MLDEIIRRLEFLEENHRKSKASISVLQEQVNGISADLHLLTQQLRDLQKQISPLLSLPARLEQLENGIQRQREELQHMISDVAQKADQKFQEAMHFPLPELEALHKEIEAVRAAKVDIPSFEEKLKARMEEAARLRDLIDELRGKISELAHTQDELRTIPQVWEEARRRDLNQISALQGEVASLRKRLDDHQQKLDLQNDTLRTLTQRINEVMASEVERQQRFEVSLQKLQVFDVDLQRHQKKIGELEENIRRQMSELDARRIQIEDSLRSVQRAEGTFTELQQRLERRTGEIAEMQRLSEERLRQEWVAFRAEEQKRWTSFNLMQEQALSEIRKALESIGHNQQELSDKVEATQEQFLQMRELNQEQLQQLLQHFHEWLNRYKRILSPTLAKK